MGWQWAPLGWDAIATLAAVVAAAIVGWRQVGIARKQADIQQRQADIQQSQTDIHQRQTDIQATGLREKIFERRLKVFDVTQAAVDAALDYRGDREANGKQIEKLNTATKMSKFLFSPDVQTRLEQTYQACYRAHYLLYTLGGNYTPEQSDLMGQERLELSRWLADRNRTLSDLFGNEMSLGSRAEIPVAEMPSLPIPVSGDPQGRTYEEYQSEMAQILASRAPEFQAR